MFPAIPQREQFWRTTLARFATAGRTVRDFCRRYRLAENAFYFWRREIAARDREPGRLAAAAKSQPTPRPKSRRPTRRSRPSASYPISRSNSFFESATSFASRRGPTPQPTMYPSEVSPDAYGQPTAQESEHELR